MLKTLIKSRLEAFSAYLSGAVSSKIKKKTQSPIAKVLLSALFIFVIAYIVFAIGALVYAIDMASVASNQAWASQTVAVLVASLLCVIGSVFTAKTQIFESKDNELLLAMPIPPKYIYSFQ